MHQMFGNCLEKEKKNLEVIGQNHLFCIIIYHRLTAAYQVNNIRVPPPSEPVGKILPKPVYRQVKTSFQSRKTFISYSFTEINALLLIYLMLAVFMLIAVSCMHITRG